MFVSKFLEENLEVYAIFIVVALFKASISVVLRKISALEINELQKEENR